MFFAPFLGMAFRLYIPMTIASYLNIQYPAYAQEGRANKWGERIADFYSIFIYSMISLGFPFAMLYVALVPKTTLLRPDFK
jgi:hypothetical protein